MVAKSIIDRKSVVGSDTAWQRHQTDSAHTVVSGISVLILKIEVQDMALTWRDAPLAARVVVIEGRGSGNEAADRLACKRAKSDDRRSRIVVLMLQIQRRSQSVLHNGATEVADYKFPLIGRSDWTSLSRRDGHARAVQRIRIQHVC